MKRLLIFILSFNCMVNAQQDISLRQNVSNVQVNVASPRKLAAAHVLATMKLGNIFPAPSLEERNQEVNNDLFSACIVDKSTFEKDILTKEELLQDQENSQKVKRTKFMRLETVDPLKCIVDGCEFTITSMKFMDKHLKDDHGYPRDKFPCLIKGCSAVPFDAYTSRNRHNRAVHEGIMFQCFHCGLLSSHRFVITNHQKKHFCKDIDYAIHNRCNDNCFGKIDPLKEDN
ncbi:hypothetical protein EBU24_01695 [bacterium]|nr:hypothetical protein [bacterium]